MLVVCHSLTAPQRRCRFVLYSFYNLVLSNLWKVQRDRVKRTWALLTAIYLTYICERYEICRLSDRSTGRYIFRDVSTNILFLTLGVVNMKPLEFADLCWYLVEPQLHLFLSMKKNKKIMKTATLWHFQYFTKTILEPKPFQLFSVDKSE